MVRAIGGLTFGFVLVFGSFYWAHTCLPNPNEEKINWLRREDVIVIQMKDVSNPDDELIVRSSVPEFTVYGDGTLLFTDPTRQYSKHLFHTQLPESTVSSILKDALDRDLFDFDYQQTSSETPADAMTYFYFKTLTEANAISATLPSNAASINGQRLRDLNAIRQRLLSIAANQFDSAREYAPSEVLQVTRTEGEPGLREALHTGEDAARLSEVFAIEKGADYVTIPEGGDGKVVEGAYRPILPYEGNFPEFEPPPSSP